MLHGEKGKDELLENLALDKAKVYPAWPWEGLGEM